MVLQAHLKKHIIALGGWLLMYTSGPPRPPVWQMTTLFPFFFLLPSLIYFAFFCVFRFVARAVSRKTSIPLILSIFCREVGLSL